MDIKFYTATVFKKVACAPCATLTRLLPGLINKYDNVRFTIVEVNSMEEMEQYATSIKSFPTTILYDNDGTEIGRQPGALGVDQFLANNT